MNKKYELTTDSKTLFGKKLFRIKALISFGDIEKGELGGYIEKEDNLSPHGNAWVSGDAEVFSTSHMLVVGPIGSRNAFTTFYRNKDNGITVKCGCFNGSIDKFLEKVNETHGDSKYAEVYKKAADLARTQIDLE